MSKKNDIKNSLEKKEKNIKIEIIELKVKAYEFFKNRNSFKDSENELTDLEKKIINLELELSNIEAELKDMEFQEFKEFQTILIKKGIDINLIIQFIPLIQQIAQNNYSSNELKEIITKLSNNI